MSWWIDHWGCLPLGCWIGALYRRPEILRLSHAHTCQTNVGFSCQRRAWIWQQIDRLMPCDLGMSFCCNWLWWEAVSDSWNRHFHLRKRPHMRQQKVETESTCCWNQLEREPSVSMKLLFRQVISSDLESVPVDKSGNHFDGSPRVVLAHEKQILWSCLVWWSRHKGNHRRQGLCCALCKTNIGGNPIPWIDGSARIEQCRYYRSSENGSMLLRLLSTDSSVELFAAAPPIMLIIEVWIFLVLSFLVSSLLIVLSISWRWSLFDSVASTFWAEIALVSWLITELLSNATDVPATPLMHCTVRSL